ncbi:MAG: DUF362 domain-containing protein [Synechococcales bacterium]|nr:DUF362 domain-containing protein [Synechococcales bacterium]
MIEKAVHTVDSATFTYHPPPSAGAAKRILVKPNLGYPVPAPVTISLPVLGQVLQGLRRVNPGAEILIVEGVCSPVSLATIAQKQGVESILDAGMRLLDADDLHCVEYPNRSPHPVRFAGLWAPKLLQEVDCRITVGAFKRTILKDQPLISASLKNLYGLLPRAKYKARSPHSRGQLHRPSVPQVLQDVYGCIGHLFDGAVVDAHQRLISPDWKPDRGATIACGKVFYGADPIAVDRVACQTLGEPIPDYLIACSKLKDCDGWIV